MANTTKDLRVVETLATLAHPQDQGRNIAGRVYYIGQAVVKDANGRLDNPGGTTLKVAGIFSGAIYDAAYMAAAAVDADEYTVQSGIFLHFNNSATNPVVLGTTLPGTKVYFEDNQTVGILSTAGSLGGVFLGFDAGRLMIGVGPQYWV